MGLILVWATPVLLFLWYVLVGNMAAFQGTEEKQEHRVSIPYWPSSYQHFPTDRASNGLSLDYRHNGIESWYLGN